MKSWAVPKGPSLNPADKRLAVMVEDHPLDYRTFEGTIPQGNYGAGTVMVWDEGTYHAAERAESTSDEQFIRDGLAKGHLSIVLEGSKLQGGFSLVKLQRAKKNEWLLIKKQDEHATADDVLEKSRSVTTGRDLGEIGRNVKGTRRAKAAKTSRKSRPIPIASNGSTSHAHIKPMLATLVDEPFDRQGWIFETKWDGYRAIAEVCPEKVNLYSRNGISFEQRFHPIVEALGRFEHEAILDGEIVVLDREGRSRFQLLQNYQKTGQGDLRYFVFDLLRLDGHDLKRLPLKDRKELLHKLHFHSNHVQLGKEVKEHGKECFQRAMAQGLEGIIAKNAASLYREGERSSAWLKIKTHSRQEAVIGGFTAPRGSRKDLGALVLGVYDGASLDYIGHSGGGIDTKGLADLRKRLDALVQKKCPFREKPKTNAPAHWVRPKLVCEVSFQEWTDDGRMRQPIFLGLREDKPAKSVHREMEASAEEEAEKKPSKEEIGQGSSG